MVKAASWEQTQGLLDELAELAERTLPDHIKTVQDLLDAIPHDVPVDVAAGAGEADAAARRGRRLKLRKTAQPVPRRRGTAQG